MIKKVLYILTMAVSLLAEVPVLQYDILSEIPHDENAFTQGLLYRDGSLWESTGMPGGGTRVREIDISTGIVKQEVSALNDYFGEGLAFYGNKLYQLSWQEGYVHIFNYPQIEEIGTIPYQGEGWGLAVDNNSQFWKSNGSDTLEVLNRHFMSTSSIQVSIESQPLNSLNELEWTDSTLWANVWFSDSLYEINPQSGDVIAVLDLSLLRTLAGAEELDKVVNGIAYVGENKFWVTGKFWEKIYLIEVID